MRTHRFLNHCLGALAVAACLGAVGSVLAAPGPRRAPLHAAEDPGGARVIVKYKALGSLMRTMARDTPQAKGPQQAGVMSRRLGLVLSDGRIVGPRIQVLRGGTGITSAALAARLAGDADVEYAVPDLRRYALAVPNDPLYAGGSSVSPQAGQWYLRAPDSTFVSAINAVGAWNVTTGSAAIVVADLDTGVLFNHPDLVNKLYPGYDFITDTGDSADGNGRDSDATDPGDWTTAGQCETGSDASDSSWHGTQTAGLIGAQSNNGIGMASVGRDVMLLPVRVLGKCGGTDSDIIAAMLWAGGLVSSPVVNAHPARVINLSLGASGSCTAAYRDAITRLTAAGVVVVASAGNDEGLAVGSPANCPGVIAVGGLRNAGTKVGFSSLGPEVAISAPGGNCVNTSGACLYPILTTTNAGTKTATTNTYSDGTNISVGTSFSSPLVAGTAALMLSANPSLTPAQLRSFLSSSARPFPTSAAGVAQCHAPNGVAQDECLCTTSTCGAGMLDAAAAVSAAAGTAVPMVRLTPGATSVVAGATVAFDGSASLAAGGRSIVAYRWDLTSGTGVAAVVGAADAATVQVRTFAAGSFTLRLTVTDSAGLRADASVSVTVNAPVAPAVQILASATAVPAGGTVSFDGSGSAAAAGLSVAAYDWRITSGANLATITSAPSGSGVTVATTPDASGSFTITLTVTDSLGQQSSASRAVGVAAVSPIASLAASALSAVVGSTVVFDATASTAPPGRSIVSFQWAIVSGGNIATFSGSTTGSTVTVATTGAGSFTLQLTVTDSGGSQDVKTTQVSVAAAGVISTSSGGGALRGGWLAGLALAVLALALAAPRRHGPGAD